MPRPARARRSHCLLFTLVVASVRFALAFGPCHMDRIRSSTPLLDLNCCLHRWLAGIASRLKPDLSAPVPKGFTKAIERMRKSQHDREAAQQYWDSLGKHAIDKKVSHGLLLCAVAANWGS